jgi:hypothetical protein
MSMQVVRQEEKMPNEVPKALREALEGVEIKSFDIRREGTDPVLVINGKVVGGWLDL